MHNMTPTATRMNENHRETGMDISQDPLRDHHTWMILDRTVFPVANAVNGVERISLTAAGAPVCSANAAL
jgi:hypothetical protein